MVDRKLVEAPSNFIAGRPKAALPFWVFGGFRCSVPLFIVMLVTGDIAVTSSIRIAQVFPRLGWQKDSRFMECLRGDIKIYN